MLIEAQGRGHRGLALPKRTVGARWEWVANATPRFTPGKQSRYVCFVQEVGRAPGPVWLGYGGKKKKSFFFYTKFRTLSMKPVPTAF